MRRLIALFVTCALFVGFALPVLAADQQKVEFATYWVVYAERGPNWKPQTDQQSMDRRMQVIENLGKLVRSGEVIIAGLVNDGSEAEFIMIVQTEDEMGLKERLSNAENVKNGMYKARIHSWFAPKGLTLEMVPRAK